MTKPAEQIYSLKGKRVWVPGHKGMVGSAILRRLEREDVATVLTAGREELDLTRQLEVETWVGANQPQAVIVSAARVGGILANDTRPVDFLYENVMIAANIINAAARTGVEKLIYLGSSCIYPKFAPQPIPEDALLTGKLEPTNEWYAVAKIAGIKLCQAYRKQYGCDFIAAMPTNLYGPGDNYDLNSSHVVPAMIRKAHEAKMSNAPGMEIWGTGSPRREFLHVDDAADAIVFLLTHYSDMGHVNVGSGEDITIEDLARLVMKTVGFTGELRHDRTKPDGTPLKLMSADLLRSMGWHPRIGLSEGLASCYASWLEDGGSDIRRNQRLEGGARADAPSGSLAAG